MPAVTHTDGENIHRRFRKDEPSMAMIINQRRYNAPPWASVEYVLVDMMTWTAKALPFRRLLRNDGGTHMYPPLASALESALVG